MAKFSGRDLVMHLGEQAELARKLNKGSLFLDISSDNLYYPEGSTLRIAVYNEAGITEASYSFVKYGFGSVRAMKELATCILLGEGIRK